MFHPKNLNPTTLNNITQMKSSGMQTPFYFGGSQVPSSLSLPKQVYNGSQGSGFHKGVMSKTHPGDLDFTTKYGDLVYHQDGHFVKEKQHPFGRGFHKKSNSKTHIGDLDFTTKRGNKVFHRKNHNIKLPHSLPFSI
jgi:hypothetical protein